MQVHNYSTGVIPYIPFFYVIWSDDLLSASEVAVIQQAVQQDTVLTKDDKIFLNDWLDKENPPSEETFKSWKNIISSSGIKLIESDTYPLTSLSQRLGGQHCTECAFNENLKHIEINLGIQPNHYSHLFEVENIKLL